VKEQGSTTWARFRAGKRWNWTRAGRANISKEEGGGRLRGSEIYEVVKIFTRQSSAESAIGVLTPLALSGALLLKKSNAPNMQQIQKRNGTIKSRCCSAGIIHLQEQ
jgi:hypothetical protein